MRLCQEFDCIGNLAVLSPESGCSQRLHLKAPQALIHQLRGQWSGPAESPGMGNGGTVGMNDSCMHMELLLLLLLFLRAGLYQNCPVWPVTSRSNYFSSGRAWSSLTVMQENGILPHFPNSETSQATHLLSSPEVECQNRAARGELTPSQSGFNKRRRNTMGEMGKGMRSIDANFIAFSQK